MTSSLTTGQQITIKGNGSWVVTKISTNRHGEMYANLVGVDQTAKLRLPVAEVVRMVAL